MFPESQQCKKGQGERQMGRPEGFDDVVSDPYTSETSGDIYNTPDVIGDKQGEETAGTIETDEAPEHEERAEAEEVGEPAAADSAVQQSGGAAEIVVSEGVTEINVSGNSWEIGMPDEKARYNPYHNNLYGNQQPQNGNPYSNTPYGSQQSQSGNPYSNSPYGSQQPSSDNPYSNTPYGSQQPQGGNPNSNTPYGSQQPQGNNPYSNNPYSGQQPQGDNPYNNNPYTGQYTQNGVHYNNSYTNVPPYNNTPYSTYAAPAKKNNTKLIIGIVVGIIILFLIAVFALTYKVISLISEERDRRHHSSYEEYEFHDDREENREKRREEDDFGYNGHDGYYDYDDGYFDDDYGYDYDSDQYYTLHDDIKDNLSYTVDFDYYEYDTDDEDVVIMVTYPVIEGDDVPNLDQLNGLMQSEIDLFKDYFEEEYKNYMDEEGSYFSAVSSGYVTYMDEEKMSIVFSESVSSDYYNYAYLYCINIDMENGVVLDNENILGIDDNFSVEFRNRSDIQNGEIPYLTYMTDQEITGYFNSTDVIVFYTPQGMEIGFNYEEGWVTVTYEEYEQYLKVF